MYVLNQIRIIDILVKVVMLRRDRRVSNHCKSYTVDHRLPLYRIHRSSPAYPSPLIPESNQIDHVKSTILLGKTYERTARRGHQTSCRRTRNISRPKKQVATIMAERLRHFETKCCFLLHGSTFKSQPYAFRQTGCKYGVPTASN